MEADPQGQQEINFPKTQYDPKAEITHHEMANEDDGLNIPKKDTKDVSFIKLMGKISKKILKAGLLNLTELTFPAVMLADVSNVEASLLGFNYTTAFINQALVENVSPLERMKMTIAGYIANVHNPSRVLEGNPPIPAQLGDTVQVKFQRFTGFLASVSPLYC